MKRKKGGGGGKPRIFSAKQGAGNTGPLYVKKRSLPFSSIVEREGRGTPDKRQTDRPLNTTTSLGKEKRGEKAEHRRGKKRTFADNFPLWIFSGKACL